MKSSVYIYKLLKRKKKKERRKESARKRKREGMETKTCYFKGKCFALIASVVACTQKQIAAVCILQIIQMLSE